MANIVDFEKVEVLRKRMLITKSQMADLLGVTRQTYYNWTGRPVSLRTKNHGHVRDRLRDLLNLIADDTWSLPEVVELSSEERFEKLKGLLGDDKT